MNSIFLDVEFLYGKVREHAANVIAKNLLSRADEEGFSKTMIKSAADVEKYDTALNMKDRFL